MGTFKRNVFITNSDGSQEVTSIRWAGPVAGVPTDPLTLRFYNGDPQALVESLIGGVRSDFIPVPRAGETTFDSNAVGQELVDEKWLELRPGTSGAWTPVDDWKPNMIDVGALNTNQYATFQARLNIPSNSTSIAEISFAFHTAVR